MNSAIAKLTEEILALGFFNPHAGVDVDTDDIAQYLHEAADNGLTGTADGFRMWLLADTSTEGLQLARQLKPLLEDLTIVSNKVFKKGADTPLWVFASHTEAFQATQRAHDSSWCPLGK
jgi:hypothetical protein